MSTRVRQALQGAAGAAGGAALNVEDVFSTYLYTGTSSAQTITNGIDLAGEGGLVWTKNRDTTGYYHNWIDTERGISNWLRSDSTQGNISTLNNAITSFNSDGYSLGTDTYAYVNNNNKNYVSWTFRKAPKFFDVVTYTGTGSAQTISHNLGSVPGMIIVKRTNSTAEWRVYHRSLGYTKYLALHNTDAATTDASNWQATPTSSVFSVGSDSEINGSGSSYVAYLFAHNNNDGGFGSTEDQDIIKCGGFTTTSTGTGSVDIGFEPQWMLIKSSSQSGTSWNLADNMRGWAFPTSSTDTTYRYLYANSTTAEGDTYLVDPTSTGFDYRGAGGSRDYVYIAIRRGPMAVPTSATDVFTPLLGLTSSSAPPIYQASHTIDMVIEQPRFGDSAVIIDRLRGNRLLKTSATNAETGNAAYTMDYQTSAFNRYSGQSTWYVGQCFRRAPNFFDVVTYIGTGANTTVDHSLGVAPEMMWIKQRNASKDWCVYHSIYAGTDDFIYLNYTNGTINYGNFPWNSTAPTSSVFSLSSNGLVNALNQTYVAYLFASLSGISKCGSYTGNGSTQNIDCGFSSGARFVLIKRTDSTGDWHVWDTERGIVAGFDPYLELNTTNAESSGATAGDYIDPLSSGFALTSNSLANASGGTYIFYAVA
jgi:hypothetical protein